MFYFCKHRTLKQILIKKSFTMCKKKFFSSVLIAVMFMSFGLFASEKNANSQPVPMPENVKAIIEKSCFGCHNTDSKNDKAKEKLDLKTIDSLTKPKMIRALKEINEVVEENEMPPAKFLEKFPDKKLTDAEKTILMDWAKKEAKALMQ